MVRSRMVLAALVLVAGRTKASPKSGVARLREMLSRVSKDGGRKS